MQDDQKRTCFVMSPFGGYNDAYYRDLFAPAIRAAGLEPRRADDIYGPSAIVADIWREIRGCAVGLADLTGRNANVLYELGLAHAITKPVVIIVRSLDDVPFDLRQLRVVIYDVERPDWVPLLQHEITQAIREVVLKPARYLPLSFIDVSHTPRVALSEPDKNMVAIEQQLASIRSELSELRQTKVTEIAELSPPPVPRKATRTEPQEVPAQEIPDDGFRVKASRKYVGKHFAVIGLSDKGWMVQFFKGLGDGYVSTIKTIDELANQSSAKMFADDYMPDPIGKWKSVRDWKGAFR